MRVKFEKHLLKTVREDDNTSSIPYNAKMPKVHVNKPGKRPICNATLPNFKHLSRVVIKKKKICEYFV